MNRNVPVHFVLCVLFQFLVQGLSLLHCELTLFHQRVDQALCGLSGCGNRAYACEKNFSDSFCNIHIYLQSAANGSSGLLFWPQYTISADNYPAFYRYLEKIKIWEKWVSFSEGCCYNKIDDQ